MNISFLLTLIYFKGATTPSSNITISQPILLDSSVELFSLTIASGGRLVWSRAGDYAMRAHFIRIRNGGELHIGGKTCRYTQKARITLLGNFLLLSKRLINTFRHLSNRFFKLKKILTLSLK